MGNQKPHEIKIRLAIPDDADVLSMIAYSAKAHWGYPDRWMKIWKPQFDFAPEYFAENESWTVEKDDVPIAFYTLQERDGNGWLENLWVLPKYIGMGFGKQLFLHALARSRLEGYPVLQLEADPNAFGFYENLGMYKIGERKSEIDGQARILPIMEIKL